MAEKPILGYWNTKGKAHKVRTLLFHLGVDFEDKMYIAGDETPGECWADAKPNLGIPFPNIPYYEDGEIFHSETNAILRTI